nr:hypothetical protein StreXyl84_25070 [Streptomyces sp. Xyl84]
MTNGGGRYWNEEAQRWENGSRDTAAAVTPPPPARPAHAPDAAAPGPVLDPDASGAHRTVTEPPTAPVPSAPPPTAPVPSVPPPTAPAAPAAPAAPTAPGPPAAPGGYSRRTVWAVVAAAAGVGVAVSLVVTLGFGGGDDGKGAPSAVSTSAASTAPEPSPSADVSEEATSVSPSPTAAEPPAGYALEDDPEGFRIAVPEGWGRQTVGSQFGMDVVNYRSGSGDRRIQVYQVAETSPDASFQLYLSDEVPKPRGFHKLALDHVDGAGVSGTRMEYTAATLKGEPDIGTWHVFDERFRAADGKIYAIAAYGPDADGADGELRDLTTALDWFCPPGTVCPAPTPTS